MNEMLKTLMDEHYEVGGTGGNCTAFIRPINIALTPCYFLITVAFQDESDEWTTDAYHPEDWPIAIGFYVEDDILDKNICHTKEEFIEWQFKVIENYISGKYDDPITYCKEW